jgi:isopentenyl diphosphate isomerase/L-lactate dehydrogenase-like FMN-dependent dehydrogenase
VSTTPTSSTANPPIRVEDGAVGVASTATGRRPTANSDPGLTWHHLATLNQRTSLPVLAKGILHPDDARRVFGLGLDGIVVSNHGGRQVDSAVAALDALVAVRHAVGSEPGRDQVLKRENTRLRSWP